MRKHLQLSVVLTAVLGFAAQSQAGDLPAPGTVTLGSSGVAVSGLLDTYFTYNLNEPANSANPAAAAQNQFRTNDRASRQFDLYEATVGFSKAADPVGFSLMLGQGTRYKVLNKAEANTGYEYLRDANATWEDGKLAVTVGRFDSGFGFESGTSVDNWNYSRGTTFSMNPEFYTGFKAGYHFGSGWSADFGVVNGINRFSDNNVGKTIPLSVGWNGDDTMVKVNAVFGSEADGSSRNLRRTLGFTARHSYSKTLAIAVDGTSMNEHDAIVIPASANGPATKKNADAYGASAYLMTSFWDKHHDNLRFEWFRDNDGALTGVGKTVNGVTLTHRYMATKNMSFWGEVRYDTSGSTAFTDDMGLFTKKNQTTVTAAATLQI